MPKRVDIKLKEGWVMVSNNGEIWIETFAATKSMCKAIASEMFALDGQTLKENNKWHPMRGVMTIVLR